MTGVLPTVLDRLEALGGLSGVRPDRITVGESAVFVELDGSGGGGRNDGNEIPDRLAGLAHNPAGSDGTAPTLSSPDLETLLAPIDRPTDESPASDGLIDRAIAVATVNALSAPYVKWRYGDPMALLEPSVNVVVTVGFFGPAVRKFEDVEVRVIEREPIGAIETPDGVTVRPFRPERTTAAMSGADVVFVTGSTLVYGGLERYLAATPKSATLVVVGASASSLPEPLFDRGVDVVAGAEITAPDRVRRAVTKGACGTDLHDRGVRKVYTTTESSTDIRL